MNALRKLGSALLPASALAALVLGGIALTASPAEAGRPIGPLCGPTYLWLCSGPGGEVLFAGTVCDKARFEKQTGMTCVPAPF